MSEGIDNPLISIVIPVYNVEKYLKKCLESVSAQTYKNIEIILVDDGSNDNSGVICDDYAKTEKRAKIIHQNNQGLSGARNTGVLASKGEYITFLDSDDWLTNDYVSFLYNLIKENNVEISSNRSFNYWDGSGQISDPEQKDFVICKLSAEDAIKELCYGRFLGSSAPDKMYKSELIKKYPFPQGKIYEDLAIMYKVIGDSNGVVYTTKKLSYYRRREGSILNDTYSDKHLYALQAAKEQLEYIKQFYPTAVKAGETKCCCVITQIMPMIISANRRDVFNEMKHEIRKYAKSLLTDHNYSLKYKIRTVAILCGYFVTKGEIKTESLLKQIVGMKNK